MFPLESYGLRSTLTAEGAIDLQVLPQQITAPVKDEVVVQMQAAPVNPTDLNLLLAGADLQQIALIENGLRLQLPAALAKAHHRRKGRAIAPGLEGAGIVIAAGPSAHSLLGQTVAVFGGGAYGQHLKLRAQDCIAFGMGFPAEKAAASFVNPLTALSMVHNMRRDGHSAIVHTAAGSSLGRMLERLCAAEKIPLINILRSEAAVRAVKSEGSLYAVDSTSPDFQKDLVQMIRQTDASVAFDAIGGGSLAGQIMAAMEEVFAPPPEAYDVYGSRRMKQVYVYGGLTTGPVEVQRGLGSAWSVSGWLMMNYLATLPAGEVQTMKDRIRAEIDTTFRTTFSDRIDLAAFLEPSRLREVRKMRSGAKIMLHL